MNPIIAIIKVRNEELIIKDTLDYLSLIVDGVVILDDASSDHTKDIINSHKIVLSCISIEKWSTKDRPMMECVHRQMLLEEAKKFNPSWIICVDADERIEGDVRGFIVEADKKGVEAIRVSLFDSYITSSDSRAFTKEDHLMNFRFFFGPEKRDIVMIWKNNKKIKFIGSDAREPEGFSKNIINGLFCQHYGKSLSIKHWKETCLYYEKYFPQYSKKWSKRKGKAIHVSSDFNRPLYSWQIVKELF